MKALILLVFLPACAAFDTPTLSAPASLCIIGYCAHLIPVDRELSSPEMTARICAAGAITKACPK